MTMLEKMARARFVWGVEGSDKWPSWAGLTDEQRKELRDCERVVLETMREPSEERPDLWEIACCAWCNYPDIEVFRREHAEGMPEGSREGWDRVFKAVRQAMIDAILTEPQEPKP